ncbi:MAG: SsrA-binding protein SmpB [Deltaproteobacteria bacterium]|nr:SsrA-binding protein SmpB [Deltaproteobacteria bacterium]
MANNNQAIKPKKGGSNSGKKNTADEVNKIICQNKRARHDYTITRCLEAGLVLRGTEVKSCREGGVLIHEAYVQVIQGEVFLINSHIAEYRQGNRFNHVPDRSRKLLLHEREIAKLEVDLRQRGQVAIPLKAYFKNGRAKLEIGIGTGKKNIDRRQDIKERECKRDLQRTMRRAR